MQEFIGEFVGSALLLLLGAGVVANVILKNTKGNNGGWIVIAVGWSMAVFVGVYSSVYLGGSGHSNPAVSIALSAIGKLESSLLPTYIIAQFSGTMLGALLAFLVYKPHFDATDDPDLLLAVFATSPAIDKPFFNFLAEFIGSFVLMFGALLIASPATGLGALEALPVGFLVLAIGLSLGGATGYAINPARDLGPRLIHTILPIKGKGSSHWSYAWVPLLGPVTGALLGAWVFAVMGS